MQLIFADDTMPEVLTHSIFLAGPSPRSKDIHDWRHDALRFLQELNFNGTVFIPIPRGKFYGEDDSSDWTYLNQINWECLGRQLADLIVFWVARDIKGAMPGFTTNVEFGEDLATGKVLYGRPAHAEKCRYLDERYLAHAKNVVVFDDMKQLLAEAVQKLGSGAVREKGETYVPLFIWQTEQFQQWYRQLKLNGNRLDEARLLSFMRIPNGQVFFFSLWVKVWIESEQRHKANEFIVSRKDVSNIVAFYRDTNDIKVLLVKEFRSPVRNNLGYVLELPGGSASETLSSPLVNAQHELAEETGIDVSDATRFIYVNSRQFLATLLTHKTYLYALELTREEYAQAVQYKAENQVFGVLADTERTYLDIVSVKNLYTLDLDYSTIGMIHEAIAAV